MFAAALRAQGIPFDLHIYEKGAHGMGLDGPPGQPAILHPWTRDCLYWLKIRQFVK
jgi:acetyl esterase/lipase